MFPTYQQKRSLRNNLRLNLISINLYNIKPAIIADNKLVSVPPSRNATIVSAIEARNSYELERDAGIRSKAEGPAITPNMINKVTRGRRVRRPTSSATRPANSSPPIASKAKWVSIIVTFFLRTSAHYLASPWSTDCTPMKASTVTRQ